MDLGPGQLLGPGPSLDPRTGEVCFVATDELGDRAERVWYHLRDFGDDPRFRRVRGHWVARIPAPPVDRIEYLFVVRSADGHEALLLDPANPRRVDGVLGAHSVLELPGYRAPDWLVSTTQPWVARPVAAGSPVAELEVTGDLLSPEGVGPDQELPLLVVHDGPEYVRLARLLDYLDWLGHSDAALRCRVLSLAPVDRDRSYAASPVYTQALVEQALPRARAAAATEGPLVGLGASLGGLALAHAAATYPGTFAGLLAQSGSFFLPQFDAHEARWPHYGEVVTATAALHADPSPLTGVVVRLTAGAGEENLENNHALARRLVSLGVDAALTTGRDGHNHTAWRDLLHPTLGELLARCWKEHATT